LEEFGMESADTPPRLSILLVDDEPMYRRLAREQLKSIPLVEIVAEAKNGTEAVQLALEHVPDMVIMDVDMPAMNGIEATKCILREIPTAQVLLFSGITSQDRVDQGFALGARAFVSKLAVRDLTIAVRAVADGRLFVSG
jgi:DNA-binding NarL/FixJ family response regulator